MISILGFIIIFIVAYFAYKTANDNGRSGPLWALAILGVGFGLQLVLPLALGIVLGIVYVLQGMPVEQIEEEILGPATIISVVALFISLVVMGLILRHVAKLPEDEAIEQIPPPPAFDPDE